MTDLCYEEAGEGVLILLIPPAGSTGSTWGTVVDELAQLGRVVTYDRRGYARSGGEPPHSMATHTADAAALLEHLHAAPAVVVGTSAGAGTAIDLAVRRPDLVRAVVAHEFPWQMIRHPPTGAQAVVFARLGSAVLRRRYGHAAEILLRAAYSYRDGGTAWDAFPEDWRRSPFRSYVPTASGARRSWLPWFDRLRLRSRLRGHRNLKAQATQLRSTHPQRSCG